MLVTKGKITSATRMKKIGNQSVHVEELLLDFRKLGFHATNSRHH